MGEWIEALDRIAAGATAHDCESQTLDFKRPTDSVQDTQHDIADAAVCFANAGGGVIVLGVLDREPGLAALVGTELDASALRRRIYEVTKPPLDVNVRELSYRDARLLEIHVQEGLDVYASRQKVPTRRFEDRCIPMSTAEISRLHDERRGTDWSEVETGRPAADADKEALSAMHALLRRVDNATLRSLADGDSADALRALNLATAAGNLTRAGELLLCQEHSDGERELIVYQHRDTVGGEVTAGRRWSGPLLTAFIETMGVIEARIGTTPINLQSGQQLQIQDYPLAAIREAVANAVMHGDHRDRRPVYVEHSPESLEVRSPGPLVTGVSPANILTHPPKPRFPSLAEAMRSLGLAEKWGQGVDRMYREMIRSGRDVPQVVVHPGDEAETSVRFLGGPPNTRIAKFVSSLPDSEQNDTDALLVVYVLTTKRNVSAPTLAPVVQRDPAATQAVLLRLASGEAQLLTPTPRSSRRTFPDYQLRAAAIAALGPAVAYQRTPRADSDSKVFEHLKEYGSINSGTVQRMFDVDVYRARAMLQDLVARQGIVRISEQTRGTAVRYGPGPHFERLSTSRRGSNSLRL